MIAHRSHPAPSLPWLRSYSLSSVIPVPVRPSVCSFLSIGGLRKPFLIIRPLRSASCPLVLCASVNVSSDHLSSFCLSYSSLVPVYVRSPLSPFGGRLCLSLFLFLCLSILSFISPCPSVIPTLVCLSVPLFVSPSMIHPLSVCSSTCPTS